ncbi:MAG: HAMP domain-containing histidine kinase [Gemmataceae bacterium]|nr:HAMP domain-containing histidine kinase [Gemmataceae bacterium]
MTLTSRLSLFFLSALAAVLVGFSAALYSLADWHLNRQLDDQLADATRTLASAAEVEPDGVEWEPHSRPLALAPGVFGDQLHWSVDGGDRVVDRSAQPGAAELFALADERFRAGRRSPRRLEYAGRHWRLAQVELARPAGATEPLGAGKHPALTLTVAVPTDGMRSTLRTLALALAGLTAGVLCLALVASRAVCRRALAPVARMAEAARAMNTDDLPVRLPHPPGTDELADLGRAFNGLLERLGEAMERERRFAGEASHQLRTPLAALIGQVEVALRRERDSEEYQRTLKTVLEQAGRLRRVVEALLFLSRAAVEARIPVLERLDLSVWVPTHLRNWGGHPRFADVACAEASGEAWAAIHPDLFAELLDALVDNALKYSPPGTRVDVRVRNEAGTGCVEVEDRGCGVAPGEVGQLGKPFFRAEAARKSGVQGTGLGLAVALRIASALGGALHIDSALGRGTRVRITLPSA